jgi:NAD-dependent deacetylase
MTEQPGNEVRRTDVATVQDWVAEADRIVVLTGAGISTDSGIPDFRGPQGVWTKNPQAEKQATLQNYLADPEVRKRAWRTRMSSAAWEARPNLGHTSIVTLQDRGQLHALITQNVDGLHQLAGIDPARVIEVHGTMHFTRCWQCDEVLPMAESLRRVAAGEDDPPCRTCGGILKSDTISFGQNLVPEVIDRAFQVASECDLLIAVGSTLQVYPVAGVLPEARRHGARVVIVNAQETGMDDLAHVVLRGGISDILPLIFSVEPQSAP